MKPFVHEKLTASLLAELASGSYEEEKPFLSIREICKNWNVADVTAKRSLHFLLSAEMIWARPKSGYQISPGAKSRALLLFHQRRLAPLPASQTWQQKRLLLTRQGSPNRCIAVIQDDRAGASENKKEASQHSVSSSIECVKGFFEEAVKVKTAVDSYFYLGTEKSRESVTKEIITSDAEACFICAEFSHDSLRRLAAPLLGAGMTVLTAQDERTGIDLLSIGFNQVGLGYQGMNSLLKKRHRYVVVLRPAEDYPGVMARLQGVYLAVKESGLDGIRVEEVAWPDPSTVSAEVRKIFERTAGMLTRGEPGTERHGPTAVLAFNYDYVVTLLPLWKTLGIKVPDGLSVIAMGSADGLSTKRPEVDVLDLDFYKMGQLAFRILQKFRQGKAVTKHSLLRASYNSAGSVRALKRFEGQRSRRRTGESRGVSEKQHAVI